MLLAIAVSSVAVGSVAAYLILRRPSPSIIEVESDNVRQELTLKEDSRDELKSAFLKGTDFYWMANQNDKNHEELTFYMIECVIRAAEKYGYVLVQRDLSGKFQGSICILPPYKSWWRSTLHFLASVIPLGRPVPEQMGGVISQRFKKFIDECEASRKEVMKSPDHWYICNLGVAGACQGQGVGRNLMAVAVQAIRNADETQRPVFLDCHDDNVKFYEKLGFVHEKRYPLRESERADPYFFNSMVFRLEQ